MAEAVAATDAGKAFVGKWKCDKSKDKDLIEGLKFMNIGMIKRNMAAKMTPELTISIKDKDIIVVNNSGRGDAKQLNVTGASFKMTTALGEGDATASVSATELKVTCKLASGTIVVRTLAGDSFEQKTTFNKDDGTNKSFSRFFNK